MPQKLVSEPGKVDGVVFKFGGQDYIVPALNVKGARKHAEAIIGVGVLKPIDQLSSIVDITLSAIQRNYPDVTQDFMENWLDLRNMREVFDAVVGQSGFKQSGEAQAAPSTGQQSTAA